MKKNLDPVYVGLGLILVIGVTILLLVTLGKGDVIIEFFKKLGGG